MKSVEKYNNPTIIPLESIENKIYLIRGEKVMIDRDLACLYGVSTKRLNEQVKRNQKRFPLDFMFRLTKDEINRLSDIVPSLRSQFATLKTRSKRGRHSKYLPYVFTEQGVAMLSSVLNNDRAISVNIAIMRAFVKLRQIIIKNKDLEQKLYLLEQKIERHDEDIIAIFNAIRKLMQEEEKPKRKIGFLRD